MESRVPALILPEIFLFQMKDLLGADFEQFLRVYESPPVRGLRLNALKLPGALPPSPSSFNTDPVPWCETGFYYNENLRPAKSIAYHAGLFYIQEPSAMRPVEVLDVERKQRVLDLCAAPGGKSVQIAGKLSGEGLLVSNDASVSRSRALVKNLERAGVTNAVVLTEMPNRLAERFPAFFDRILVDAPCSGEGMFRRDADAVKAYTANKPDACAAMQREILRHAATMLAPGGLLVYSTCTFNTLENEGTIDAFLSSHADFSLIETERIWPHKSRGEGHFVALLEKKSLGLRTEPHELFEKSSTKTFSKFFPEILKEDFFDGKIISHGEKIFLQKTPIDLRGLRVARSGWFLGENAKDRFVPSQALAMGLRKEQARHAAELSEDNAWRYLRGETLPFEIEIEKSGKPWVLVCHDGFPLGWARLVQGRLKNNLPVGWAVK